MLGDLLRAVLCRLGFHEWRYSAPRPFRDRWLFPKICDHCGRAEPGS